MVVVMCVTSLGGFEVSGAGLFMPQLSFGNPASDKEEVAAGLVELGTRGDGDGAVEQGEGLVKLPAGGVQLGEVVEHVRVVVGVGVESAGPPTASPPAG